MFQLFQPSSSRTWNPCWIDMSGPDARDFLHRLTTINARDLDLGQGAHGCFLNAQGRIRAVFTLWHYGPEEYGFEVQAGPSESWSRRLLEVIDQFTFSERFRITSVDGLQCLWLFCDPAEEATLLGRLGPEAAALRPMATVALEEELRVCHHGSVDFGRPWISVWGRPGRLERWQELTLPSAGKLSQEELERWRISSLRPAMDAEVTEEALPLEVGLRDFISQGKGCYPGQEVIERIVSQGAPPRRLALIEGAGRPPAPGTPVRNLAEPSAEVGVVTSSVATGDRFAALALIRKIHAKEGLAVRADNDGSGACIVRVAAFE